MTQRDYDDFPVRTEAGVDTAGHVARTNNGPIQLELSGRETPKTDDAPIAVPTVITTIATMKSSQLRYPQQKPGNDRCSGH
jgi:hypothetical protein